MRLLNLMAGIRKRGQRNAKKFVGSALSGVWRARTVGSTSTISSLSPVAAKFVPAPRWGNSPIQRYPLVLASASSVPASIKVNSAVVSGSEVAHASAVVPVSAAIPEVSPPSTPTQGDCALKYPDVFRFEDSDPYFYLLHRLEDRVNPNFVKGADGGQVGPLTSHALLLHQIYVTSAPYLDPDYSREALAVGESTVSGSCLVSSEFAEGAGAMGAAAGAAAVAFAAAASARAAISAVQDSLGVAKRRRKRRKRDARKFVSSALSRIWRTRAAAQASSASSFAGASTVVPEAAVGVLEFGPAVPTAVEVDAEVCGCLDGDALFDICFQVLVPTLSVSLPTSATPTAVQICVALLKGKDAEFLRYAMRDTSCLQIKKKSLHRQTSLVPVLHL